MHTIEFFTNSTTADHSLLFNYIKNLLSKPKSQYYKLKAISSDIECKNAFIVIKPHWDSKFEAAILPMCFYDDVDILEVDPILIDPKLVSEWYIVETNMALYVLDFQSNGNLKDTRHEHIC